jgi:hypothetical protein
VRWKNAPLVATASNALPSNAPGASVANVSTSVSFSGLALSSSRCAFTSISASAIWNEMARVRSKSNTSHTRSAHSHGRWFTKSVRNHDPVTAPSGVPHASIACDTDGNLRSTNVRSTAWSTALASIELVKYPGRISSTMDARHQNAASSSMSSKSSAARKFMPWQYPTAGLCNA